MSFSRSPKRREYLGLGYKSDDESIDSSSEISPSQTFNREHIQGEGSEDGDSLHVTNPHDGSEIPAGNIGWSDPQGILGTLEMLRKDNQKMKARTLNNLVVQLMFGLCHAKILTYVENAADLYPGQYLISFSTVLNDPLVEEEVKQALLNDESYIALTQIMNRDFWTLVDARNARARPSLIDLEEIGDIIHDIENSGTDYLTRIQSKLFLIAKSSFEGAERLSDIEELVEIFNSIELLE